MTRRLDPSLSKDPRRRVQEEVDAEIQSHFEGTVDLLVARGMTEEEARAEARRRFGDPAEHRRRIARLDHRRMTRRRTMEWIQGVRSGVGQAFRGMARSPGFAVAVVLTLALGIGANSTMFGVIDRLLLRAPSGIEHPDEVRNVWLQRRFEEGGAQATLRAVTWPDVQDLVAIDAFQDVAAWSTGNEMTLGEGEGAERIRVTIATASLFRMLGATPRIGRFYTTDEDAVGAPATVVLSYEFWRRRFGADPGVLGRVLHLGDGRYQVIGVAEPGFTGADLEVTDAWIPLWQGGTAEMGDSWYDSRGWWWLEAAVRLAPNVSDEAAAAQATAAHRAARADSRGYYDPQAKLVLAPVVRGRSPELNAEDRVARWLAGVALLVLLVACANVANLHLARAVGRQREIAVRTALGGSRRGLVAHFLGETTVLALVAGAIAVGIAVLGTRVLFPALLPEVAPGRVASIRLFLFTAGAALLASLLAGLLPALRASRIDPAPSLRDGGRTATRHGSRLQEALVMAQAALSAILLVGAGLFLASLRHAGAVDLGFDADQVAWVKLERTEADPSASDDERATTPEVYARIETALDRLPGVEVAARTVTAPFGLSFGLPVRVPGMDSAPRLPSGPPTLSSASPDYFRAMGQQVLAGRAFTDTDLGESAEPVVIVNQVMAEHVWPDSDPLSGCVQVGGADSPCSRVVGVVENTTWSNLGEDPRMMLWVPLMSARLRGVGGLVVRTVGPPAEQAEAIRREIRAVEPSTRYVAVEPLADRVGAKVRSWRLGASLFGAFGLLAVLVAGIGMYGLLSFDVARRDFEIGVRRALGASEGSLIGGVLLRALRAVAIGAGAGLVVAVWASPRIAPLLFQTSPRDSGVFLTSGLVLLIVGIAAAGIPALRAARVDPMEALRAE